jgi:hypothetical protein
MGYRAHTVLEFDISEGCLEVADLLEDGADRIQGFLIRHD